MQNYARHYIRRTQEAAGRLGEIRRSDDSSGSWNRIRLVELSKKFAEQIPMTSRPSASSRYHFSGMISVKSF